jgi:hypothetical protein
MLAHLQARGEQMAAAAIGRAKRRIVRGVDTPGISARETADGVVLSGRGLRRRLFLEPQLRWIGRLFR